MKAVSMGQGQEYHARKMMTECMATGKFFMIFMQQV
jgi:hypothetical protein